MIVSNCHFLSCKVLTNKDAGIKQEIVLNYTFFNIYYKTKVYPSNKGYENMTNNSSLINIKLSFRPK